MRRYSWVSLLLVGTVVACGSAEDSGDTAATSQAATSTTGFHVVGSKLQLNGKNFQPLGFNMIGMLSPPGCTNGDGVRANQHFNQAEMTAAKSWGANLLRFQISQSGLIGSHSAEYLAEVKAGVTLIRDNGFAVILSMQDQGIGCGPVHPLASSQTVAAWKVLAPAFASWNEIMFELFNEPQNGETSADWAQWKSGGKTPLANEGDTAVGMQQLVTDIRALGANNILIADGGSYAEHLDGVPLLTDTATGRGIMYAAHPYYFTPGESEWETRYGYLTAKVPVIVTEWNYKASDCGGTAEKLAPSFLSFLDAHDIGMTAMAFDFPPLLTTGWTWAPNECGTSVGGPGTLVQNWFKSH